MNTALEVAKPIISTVPRMRRGLIALLLCVCCTIGACSARAAGCRGSDDELRPLPPAWVAPAVAAFGLKNAPPELIARATVWRCVQSRVLACFVGANLPCGKLDRRSRSEPATNWCRAHADGPVPAAVIGHDSLWQWSCRDGAAIRTGPLWHLDPRGFARENWKPLEGPLG